MQIKDTDPRKKDFLSSCERTTATKKYLRYTDKSNRVCKYINIENGEAIFKIYYNNRNYYFKVSNNKHPTTTKKEVTKDNPANSLSHISEGTERDTREQRLAETLDKTQEAFELD